MWHLTRAALHNRLVTLGIVVVLVGLSMWALLGLQQELIPDIELPYITVLTVYPQEPADVVAAEVSTPLEQAIWERWGGKGLKHLYSTSAESMSMIMAEFEFGTGMDQVSDSFEMLIRQADLPPKVAGAVELVPDLKENPSVIPINIAGIMPLVVFSLSGDATPAELKAVAEADIVPALSEIEGVLSVDTAGGENDRVIITLDPEEMDRHGLSASRIIGALPPEYQAASRESLAAQVAGTPLGMDNVTLGTMATVDLGPTSAITRTNGKPSLTISVYQAKGANTVSTANAVVDRANQLAAGLGGGLEMGTVMDQSEFIEKSIHTLVEKALIGGALAVVIVFLFLMAVRASLVTAISIPISVLLGFGAMYVFNLTINILTLSAMSIAVGRLIDDSIVIVEVIYRRLQSGESFREAAIGGAKEVATPITAATLATVAIFLPLAFVGGIVGELFVPFALTVTFAMLASLLVALMVVPALSNFLVGGRTKPRTKDSWYEKAYVPVLKWSLGHRAITLVIATALFLGSLGLLAVIGTSFMSGMSEETVTVEVQMPPGTDIGATSDVAAGVEAILAGYDQVKTYYSTVGTSTSLMGAMSAASGGGSNTAQITAYLKPGTDVDRTAESLRADCQGLPGGDGIVVSTSMGADIGFSGVEISIQGDDPEAIAATAKELFDALQEVDGMANLASELTMMVPKLDIRANQQKIFDLGLSAEQIGLLTQEYYLLTNGGDLPGHQAVAAGVGYGLHMDSVAARLTTVEQAGALPIGWPPRPLAEVADVALVQVPTHISHTDLKLSGTISGAITKKDVGAVNAAVEGKIASLSPHEGVEVKIAGITEIMNESLGRLSYAILAAVFVSFLVVAITLRSVLNPLIIMVSLPLAIIGASLGLLLGGYTLGVSGMMGMLMLVGIVLTNAIVLIAVVEQLRQKGLSTYDALIQGGKTRLRPILMTALTTIFAMVPLALGVESGTVIAGELAVVVIGGMFSSTLLTLVVIPVLYSLSDRLRRHPAPVKVAPDDAGSGGPAGS